MGIQVAISQVVDGNMYVPTDQTNAAAIANRAAWLETQGHTMDDTTRVHITYEREDFCQYREVTNADKGIGMRDGNVVPADALIVTAPGHALLLPIADCVATAVYDPIHNIAMLAHLGRHSLEQQGGEKIIQHLVNTYGSNPAELELWLGPAPSKESYPIFKLSNMGMKEVLFTQLSNAGISPEQITDNAADTETDDRYFSHSAFLQGLKPEDGRFAMVVSLTGN